MGEIRVADIKDGDILKQTVRNISGEEIIARGTALRPEYSTLLDSLGIDKIVVEDSESTYEECPFEDWVGRLQKIMEQHIYHGKNSLHKMEALADEIQAVMEQTNIETKNVWMEKNIYHHTIFVTVYGIKLAQKLSFSKDRMKEFIIGCLLHDIGLRYMTIPYMDQDMESLSPKDIFEYKKHTVFGYTALESEGWVSEIAKRMVLSHHEKLDGSGFPLKQKNKEEECRIIQIVDAYFSKCGGIGCVSESPDKVLKEIENQAGKLYDVKIVKLFVQMMQ